MNQPPIHKEDLLRTLPDEWPVDLRSQIRDRVETDGRKVVVLDDDPTGTQTVHGIPVITEWSEETLKAELKNDLPAFYILTNSRSLPPVEARTMNKEIGSALVAAGRGTGRDYVVVSRSDSTLRGHFPEEVEALAAALSGRFDGWIIHPFFLEGGRYTIGDIHYVDQGGLLTPAGETEFARDSVFGYRSSNLCAWVEEKTQGQISAGEVLSVSIEDIRRGGPERITKKLTALKNGMMCVVNSAGYRDVEVFIMGLLDAESRGKRFLYRTAASFVQVRAGLRPRPVLTRSDLAMPESGGGLALVGSYVPRTTAQLEVLLSLPGIKATEIRVASLLKDASRFEEIRRVTRRVESALRRSEDMVVYTTRRIVRTGDAERDLMIGSRISEGLIEVLRSLSTPPRYLIAKGGITASDLATGALGVRRALVLGQILPGVPLWRLGPESRFSGIPYVVFPGNVGGPEAIAEVVTMLKTDPAEGDEG